MRLAAYLPTYQSAADALEQKNNGGVRLVGWTLMRSTVIAAPLLLLGVPFRKAAPAALITSAIMSAGVVLYMRHVVVKPYTG